MIDTFAGEREAEQELGAIELLGAEELDVRLADNEHVLAGIVAVRGVGPGPEDVLARRLEDARDRGGPREAPSPLIRPGPARILFVEGDG